MYPISDLTAFCRRTTGDVPPKLVGASTTVVGSKMYLYGGRLVSERKMVSDIYMFDLETFRWEKLQQTADDDVPQARYFHSADTWNNHLIIFGGMAIQPHSDNPEDLCVLNDVRLFDLGTCKWLPAAESPLTAPIPKARYAHLSSITSNRLFIIGGQDLNNVWLDDVHVYDLLSQAWVQRRDYPRHCGTYRSVAVVANKRVRLPQEEGRYSSPLGTPGTRFNADKTSAPTPDVTQSDTLVHLPYSADPTDDYPCDIFLFSNYNFTDVQRELEVFSPLPGFDFTVSDRSQSMTGAFFPPGLRFPTGAILGTHFIIAGTYLSQTFQSFSIWALDLVSMTWSRVDPGSTLSSTSGSWFRSCLWPEANKFLVFGNRHANLVEDYNRRLLSWDHVICIDLEAFGIYQPPPLALEPPQQELGLAALEEGVLADFEIVCDDGRKIKCSRKLLEDRWPWFKEQRRVFIQAAARAIETTPTTTSASTPLSDVRAASDKDEARPDPRLTPRAFHLSEPYPITLAFLQYLYSMALITPLQQAPAVLSQLLLLSSTYEMPHLQSLVKHAMHRALTFATSVGIYGVSTLCNCRSLQIRALRVVMAYSQKRPGANRSRADRDGSGGSRNNDAANGTSGNDSLDKRSAARPRGMSDASYMRGPSDNSGASNGREYSNVAVDLRSVASESDLAFLCQASANAGLKDFLPDISAYSNRIAAITESLQQFPSVPRTTKPSSAPRRPKTSPAAVRPPMPQGEFRSALLPPQSSQSSAPSVSSPLRLASHPRQHTPAPAILSVTSEEEILALAAILSPVTEADETDEIYAAYASNHHNTVKHTKRAVTAHGYPHDRPRSSTVSSSTDAPISPGSDGPQFDDYLTVSPTSFSSHPFRSRQRYHSDTPSVGTTASYSTSSISTPPLSRAPSYQQLASPASSNGSSFVPTPIDLVLPALGVIHERQLSEEDSIRIGLDPFERKIPEHQPLNVEVVGLDLAMKDMTMRERRGLPHLDIQTAVPNSSAPIPKSRPTSSSRGSTDTALPSPQPQSRGSAFSRLFKSSKSTDHLPRPNSSSGRDAKHEAKMAKEEAKLAKELAKEEAKLAKEEEKRRQKQMAKERRERLAHEFQARARAQSDADALSLTSSSELRRQRAPTWEEEAGLYNEASAWAL